MALTIETENDINRVKIDGDLTIYNASEYCQIFKESFKSDKNLEIDLSAVEEVDTSGLQILAVFGKQVIDNGAEVSFSECSDDAAAALKTCRLLAALNCE